MFAVIKYDVSVLACSVEPLSVVFVIIEEADDILKIFIVEFTVTLLVNVASRPVSVVSYNNSLVIIDEAFKVEFTVS